MLTSPNCFLAWKWFPGGFSSSSSQRMRWDRPTCSSQHFLLAPLEDRIEICLFPFFRISSQSPRPCKDNQDWTPDGISQFPQDSLCVFNLFKCSLTWSSSTKSKPSLLWIFTLVAGSWDFWWWFLLMKTQPKTALTTLAFFVSSITRCPVADTDGTHVCLSANLRPISSQLALTCSKAELHALQRFLHIKGNSPSLSSWPVPSEEPVPFLCSTPAMWTIPQCLCDPRGHSPVTAHRLLTPPVCYAYVYSTEQISY